VSGTSPGDRSALTRFSFAALGLAFVLSCWGWFWRLDDLPPWLDFDSATLGIFVNNESFREDYAYGFRDSPVDQDRYRADWAAEFLPATVVLSALQRMLGIPPDAVGDLLEAVALLLGAAGMFAVFRVALRRGGCTPAEAVFVLGLTSSLPAFLLYLRTTQPHFLFSFAMFWTAVAAIDRWLDTRSTRTLALLAVTMALYAVLPYVPIVVLPLVGVALAAGRGRVGSAMRDSRLYAAAAAAALLYAGLVYAVAVTHEPTWQDWSDKASRFVASRSRHAWPGGAFDPVAVSEKATKLVHQHFVHQRDLLGDQTRNDHLWTLPRPHVVWILLLPFPFVGIVQSWRRRDRTAGVFGAVLASTYALALTAGAAEGRYLLTAVPSLAFFTMVGVRTAASAWAPYPAVLALVLVAAAANSFVLVSGDYEDAMVRRWRAMAGLRETLAAIRRDHDPSLGLTRDVHLSWPDLRYEGWLYASMLGNQHVRPFAPERNLAEIAVGEPLFAACDGADDACVQGWKARGFRDSGEVVDRATGHRRTLLWSAP
jgi:hypothetical protein